MGKTALGMDENIESALCYAFWWVSGVVFFVLEKDNKNVRFHAMQSIIVFGGLNVLSVVVAMVMAPAGILIMGLGLAFWLVLMIKAYNRENFKLPVLGDIALNIASGQQAGAQQQPPYQQAPPMQQPPYQAPPREQPPYQAPQKQQPQYQAPQPQAPAQKIFCQQCGAQAKPQDRFCEKCGSPLAKLKGA